MKADYEPWWNFDDMQEKYFDQKKFHTYEEYESAVHQLLLLYRQKYQFEKQKNNIYYAFWNEGENYYCEGCDEELQLYYGIILSHPINSLVK